MVARSDVGRPGLVLRWRRSSVAIGGVLSRAPFHERRGAASSSSCLNSRSAVDGPFGPSPFEAGASCRWRFRCVESLRAVVVCAIACVSYAVPVFSLLTGLTGGFGNNILGFILPPLFYLKLIYDKNSEKSKMKFTEVFACAFTVLFGL